MTLSADGNRAYIADPDGEMLILDVSEIQARKANPQAREVSRLTWEAASIPQNAIPFTRGGKPYVLEFDEYTQGTTGAGDANAVGAARIIDIADERAPRVVANLRLQVNQPADHAAASSDPGALEPRPGLRGALLQPLERGRPDRRGVLVHRLRAARVRHQRPAAPEGDRLLRRAHAAARRERVHGQRLRDVQAGDRAGAARGLVLRRRDRLLRRCASRRRSGPAAPARAAPAGRRGAAAASHAARRSAAGIGRVRLGMTRKALARRLPAPRRKTRRSWRWCVKGGKGAVSAAFAKSGRVALVATTASRRRKRSVSAGTSTRRLRRRYPHRTAVGRAIVRAGPHSTRIFGIRGGKVRYVAVARARTIARPTLLRGYLRDAGVRPAADGALLAAGHAAVGLALPAHEADLALAGDPCLARRELELLGEDVSAHLDAVRDGHLAPQHRRFAPGSMPGGGSGSWPGDRCRRPWR